MKTLISILLCIMPWLFSNAQTIAEIMDSPNYIWGTGESQNMRNADKEAMDALVNKISMSLINQFKGIANNNEDVKKIIETYTNTIQQQTKRIVSENPDKTEVIRYFDKADLNRLFEGRKKKILEYLKIAQKNEADFIIGDAVRYYYWALVLLRTHPFPDEIKPDSDKDNKVQGITEITQKLNEIFSNIEIAVKTIEDNNAQKSKSIYFKIKYKGKPVENYDYTYWNGKTWTNLVSSKNGNAYAEFSGSEGIKLGSLKIKGEYIFENKSKMDLELYNVIQNTEMPYFAKSEIEEPFMKVISEDINLEKDKPASNNTNKPVSDNKEVPVPSEKIQAVGNEKNTSSVNEDTITANTVSVDTTFDKTPYQNVINRFIVSIEMQNYDGLKDVLTENGKDGFDHLIKYGKAKLIDKNAELKYIKFDNNILVRSIPMIFTFENNDKQFVEELTFSINKDLLIDNIAFSLSKKALDDILAHTKWPEENKLQLIQFMENYKTAYALERLDYLESIFSNDALIIIGRVLEKGEPLDGMYGSFKKDVEYIRLSKAEYMDRLRAVFSQNEFVNIQFEGNEIRKKNNSNEYGIQIIQNYYSTNYADKGYLFLYIDMRDSLNPRILVRSWQPEKNADGTVPGLSDFF